MRSLKDKILNGLTYISSGLSVFVLLAILLFIFSNGIKGFDFRLLFDDYNAKCYRASINSSEILNQSFTLEGYEDISKKYGIALVDHVDEHHENIVLIEAIDPSSPLLHLKDESIENGKGLKMEVGQQIDSIEYIDQNGIVQKVGYMYGSDASDMIQALDEALHINEIAYRNIGGGFRGSIVATFYLIIIALVLALPIGIGAAIYLNEYAIKNKLNGLIQSMIEMLTGVPSIIFGLMGVSVLYPITQLFNATTSNILLGGMTLSIIILPVIIKNTQEALINVPKGLKDASLALGANETQTLFKVILPKATPTILTGVLLSIGRIIGESAALIYTMGTVVVDHPTLTSQGTSLAVHIYKIMSGEQPNFQLACAISMVILVFVLILNVSVKLISKKLGGRV